MAETCMRPEEVAPQDSAHVGHTLFCTTRKRLSAVPPVGSNLDCPLCPAIDRPLWLAVSGRTSLSPRSAADLFVLKGMQWAYIYRERKSYDAFWMLAIGSITALLKT